MDGGTIGGCSDAHQACGSGAEFSVASPPGAQPWSAVHELGVRRSQTVPALSMFLRVLNSQAETVDELAAQQTNRLDCVDQTIDQRRCRVVSHCALPHATHSRGAERYHLPMVQLLIGEVLFVLNAAVFAASKIESIVAPT
jgi:hypothetical protein